MKIKLKKLVTYKNIFLLFKNYPKWWQNMLKKTRVGLWEWSSFLEKKLEVRVRVGLR